MEVTAIRGRTLAFLAEWVSSTIGLLFHPSAFIPPAGKRPLTGAAQSSLTRKQVGFAASSVFTSLVVFQLVARRSHTDTPWDSIKESLPFSLLLVGSWIVWSVLLALILKAFGATRAPVDNVLFGVRVLATFYLFSMIISTLAFLAFGNRWIVFQWVDLISGFGLYTFYCPFIFGRSNGIERWRFAGIIIFISVLSTVKGLIGLGDTTDNPWTPPATNAPEPPQPPHPPLPVPEPPQPQPSAGHYDLDVLYFDPLDAEIAKRISDWAMVRGEYAILTPMPSPKEVLKQDVLWYYEDNDRAAAEDIAAHLDREIPHLYPLHVERAPASVGRDRGKFTLRLLGAIPQH